jgi:hypothetical protein
MGSDYEAIQRKTFDVILTSVSVPIGPLYYALVYTGLPEVCLSLTGTKLLSALD